jgi:PadR family transcriptional regulator PadR
MFTPNKDLVASSSVPLVLAILSAGDSYGYEIIQKVDQLSHGRWSWSEGMLYPVLHKLEKGGLIRSWWMDVAGQRRRRYYSLESAGKEELARRMEEWNQVHAILTDAVRAIPQH